MATGKVEKGGGKAWRNGKGKDGRWEEVERCQSSEEEARIHGLCDWGRFYGRGPQFFNSLDFFIVKQQKTRGLYVFERRFGCMSFNYFNIFKSFKCFKGAMRPRHTYVCGFKGGRLQG